MVFKAILFAIEKVVLPKLGESFLCKMGENATDNAFNNVNNIKDFERTVTTLKDNLKSLSAKASDVVEEIKKAELSGKKKRKREVDEWLRQVESIDAEWATYSEPEGLMRRLEDGGRAAQLSQQVQKLLEQSWNFGELLLDDCGAGRVTLLTTGMVGEAFQENLEKIWRLLEMGEVSSIALYGMGGVGKSTLAKQIHNRLVEQSSSCVFWVTVSEGINIKSLQDKITSSLGVRDLLDGVDEVLTRAAKLRDAISKKNNPVLILDDVWEYIDLREVGCTVSKEVCRLIITTRSLGVCHRIQCKEIIAVEILNEEEAWKLFSETLGEETKLDDRVKKTAKSVAKLCDGLPLGIITVAGSMRGETNEYTWRNTSVELKKCLVGGDDGVFHVLKHSFDRLHKHGVTERSGFNSFQRCFLYCSLYPEDWKIPLEELVEKLISDGLVEGGKSRREEVDQGHVIVDLLVKVCLLESCVDSDDKKCVKMHDLVRGMALKIGGGKYMVRSGDYSLKEIPMEQEWTEQLENVSLMHNSIRRIGEGTSSNCPNLSTLLLQGNYDLQVIPDPFFRRMLGLRTLDLSHTRISRLPNSISELQSLKALLLERCRVLKHVPDMGKLKALKELNLDGTPMEEVPQGVDELFNLKILSLDDTPLKVLPIVFLLKLVRLQILRLPRCVQVAIEENHKQVEEFRGGMENVRELNRFITSRVHDHTIYMIHVGSPEEESFYDGYYNECDKVVTLVKCNLEDEKVRGQSIEYLKIEECDGMNKCLSNTFSRFHNLRRLRIKKCRGVEYISGSELELASGFSTLEEIHLSFLYDLKGLVESERASVVFSSLTSLQIHDCDNIRSLGLSLSEFPKLKSLYIIGCSKLEELFKDDLGSEGGRKKEKVGGASTAPPEPPLLSSSLLELLISGCDEMRRLGISVLEVLNLVVIKISKCSRIEEIFEDHRDVAHPNLQELDLGTLPRLKRVCRSPIICNSIIRIRICMCPRLMKKLPLLHLDDPPPPSLLFIDVEREWWESLEWENPSLPALLQPLLTLRETDEEEEEEEFTFCFKFRKSHDSSNPTSDSEIDV